MSDEYYRPTIIEPKDLDIDGTDYNADLNVIKEGNTIKVTMDQDVMIQRVSHEIYSNFESGIRELINNEYRACRQARDKYNAKPKVQVTINARTQQLTIEGIDSLGISVRVFDKVLRRLGVSGNVDGGNEIGQFGMGFASYTTLSELITVETYSREDEQQYAFLGDRGIDFKILPKPDRDTYGTKLSLTCKDSVYWYQVIEKIEACALFSTIPTTIIVEDDGKKDDEIYSSYDNIEEGVIECSVFNSGKEFCRKRYELQASHQHNEIGKSTRGLCDNQYAVGFHKEVHIDNDDYEFYGIFSVAKMHRMITGTNRKYSMFEKRLVNTPIDGDININGNWSCYYLNIKDERKFVPTADRDRLKDESCRLIENLLNNELRNHFTGLGITSIKEYNASLHKCVLDNLYVIKDVMPKEDYEISFDVVSSLNHKFPTVNNRRISLREMMSLGKEIVVLKSLRSDMMTRITEHRDGISDKPIQFIRWKAGDWTGSNSNDLPTIFEEVGVIYGEQYLKDNKVKGLARSSSISKSVAENAVCVLYHQGNHPYSNVFGAQTSYWVQKYSTTVGEVNESVTSSKNKKQNQDSLMIVHKDDWNDVYGYSMYQNSDRPFCVMKPRKGFSENIDSYSDKKKLFKDRKFQTLGNKRKTLEEITKRRGTKGYHIGMYLVENESDRINISKTFTDEKYRNLNAEEYSDIILVEDVKELICLWAYFYQEYRLSQYQLRNLNSTLFMRLVNDWDNKTNVALMRIKDDGHGTKAVLKMEEFRKTIPKDMYKLFIHAVKDSPESGQEFIDTINRFKDD